MVAGVIRLPTPYDHDGAGWDTGNLAAFGLVGRQLDGRAIDDVASEADSLIEHALPTAVDLNQKAALGGGMSGTSEIVYSWMPAGSRDTLMPPNPRGERIYSVEVLINRFVAGDPLARISFISRAEADKLDGQIPPNDIGSLPTYHPGQVDAYVYRLDRATVQRIVDLLYQHS